MAKTMTRAAVLSLLAALATAAIFYYFHIELCLTLAITFGTTAYHLWIRLLVGTIYNAFMSNHADYAKPWYRLRPWEEKLYARLRVKTWKQKMPTYDASLFSPEAHSWDEIAQAMCQAELVHKTNILLSFLPLAAVLWFSPFFIFLLTSLGAALFDLTFVIIQRYNRGRVLRIVERQK